MPFLPSDRRPRARWLTRTVFASCVALVAGRAAALNIDSSSLCEFDTAYDIRLQDDQQVLLASSHQTILLGLDGMQVDGEPVKLTPEQAERVERFRTSLQRFVPAATTLVLDAASLGLTAVTAALEALGGDDDALARIQQRSRELQNHLHERFDGQSLLSHSFQDEVLESELASTIGDVASEIAQAAAGLAIQAIFDPDGVEKRTKDLDQLMDDYVEQPSKDLERRSDDVCAQVRSLDALETEIGRFDVFRPSPEDEKGETL